MEPPLSAPERLPVNWQVVIDAIGLPVSVHDRNHVVRLANRAFLERLGLTEAEVLGAKCHTLAHCADEPVALCPHRSLLERGVPVEQEFMAADGKRAVGVSCYPLYDADDELLGSVHMVRDVTELVGLRQRQERQSRAVAQSLEVLRTYLAAFSVNTGRPIPFENPHLRRCHEVRACGDPECANRHSENPRCWQTPSPQCGRMDISDPVERLAACHTCDVYRAASPDDLTALGESFNDLVFLLREKEQQLLRSERLSVLGELGATLAHELRSPLNALSIQAQRLGRRTRGGRPLDPSEVATAADAIVAEVRRLDGVIENFARSVARPTQAAPARVIHSVLEDACGGVRYQASGKGVEVTLDCSGRHLQVPGRLAEGVRVILFHLLLNAVEATPSGGRVAVTCATRSGRIALAVEDSGPGVPAEIRTRVFDAFYTTKPEGTGLGLATVAQLIRRLGGDVSLEGSSLGGACFRVSLPLATAEPVTPERLGG